MKEESEELSVFGSNKIAKNRKNSLGFRKFHSTFANQSGPFKRTIKVTGFFVVSDVGTEMVFGVDPSWVLNRFRTGFRIMKKGGVSMR